MTDKSSETDLISDLASQILETLQVKRNRSVIRHLVTTALEMAHSDYQRLNLKIASDSLHELANAFKVFEPYHLQRKITLFGSARTKPTDPSYLVAREVASQLAQKGWMTITGAGQGIMQAGLEGAGPEMSFGVNIKLPFEQSANQIIANDPKLVEMKYFFTRKVMLIKESDGFVVMPGGFGTLDETFELLTLVQTGKAQPAPIVLLNSTDGTYWQEWEQFIKKEVVTRGLVSVPDQSLYLITQDIDKAVDEIVNFYRNYHSIRFASNRLVVRTNFQVTEDELKQLNADFPDICSSGTIERCEASQQEISDNDNLNCFRLSMQFNQLSHGRLRSFIDSLNTLPSANQTTPEVGAH